ncbi:hypothetical protein HYW75_05750 [Candidatus Pacearchaeota archaeon]|nr:hypothetical protein [Candidatus Pacearchaeota archaeon]
MAEEVQTGGVMSFRYDSSNNTKLSESQKSEIEEAYKQAEERKKRERRNKIIKWGIFIIALLLIMLLLISKL